MYNLIFSVFLLAIISFIISVNLNYYNRPTLKFAADYELDTDQTDFKYRNILENVCDSNQKEIKTL